MGLYPVATSVQKRKGNTIEIEIEINRDGDATVV